MQRCWPRATPDFGSASVISSFLLQDIPRHPDTRLFEVQEAFKRSLLLCFQAHIRAYMRATRAQRALRRLLRADAEPLINALMWIIASKVFSIHRDRRTSIPYRIERLLTSIPWQPLTWYRIFLMLILDKSGLEKTTSPFPYQVRNPEIVCILCFVYQYRIELDSIRYQTPLSYDTISISDIHHCTADPDREDNPEPNWLLLLWDLRGKMCRQNMAITASAIP